MIITKRTELQNFFDNIINKNDNEVVKVCTLGSDIERANCPVQHSIDDALYIIFKNNDALIIEYYNVCSISVEHRHLTEEEKVEIAKMDCMDFFNCASELYDYHTKKFSKSITLPMDYDKLERVEVRYFEGNYDIWKDNEIITEPGTDENFDEIIFVMKNGNTIHIKPEDAEMDGYLDVWFNKNMENGYSSGIKAHNYLKL